MTKSLWPVMSLAAVALLGAGCGTYTTADTDPYEPPVTVGSIAVVVSDSSLPVAAVQLAYTVTDTVTQQVVAQETVAYTGGTPSALVFTNIPTDTEQVVVQALDANGHVVVQATGTVQVTAGQQSVDTVALIAPAPTALAFLNAPANVVTGSSLPTLIVVETDANQTVALEANDVITLTLATNPGNATLSGSVSVTAVNGVAQFPGIALSAVGTGYALAASSNSTGPSSATSASFNVVAAAGAPSQLVFTVQPPTSAAQNQVLAPAPQVAVEDSNATVVNTAGDPVTLTLAANGSGAALAGPVSLSPTQGLVTFSGVSLTAQGSGFTLQATAANASPAISAPFSVTP